MIGRGLEPKRRQVEASTPTATTWHQQQALKGFLYGKSFLKNTVLRPMCAKLTPPMAPTIQHAALRHGKELVASVSHACNSFRTPRCVFMQAISTKNRAICYNGAHLSVSLCQGIFSIMESDPFFLMIGRGLGPKRPQVEASTPTATTWHQQQAAKGFFKLQNVQEKGVLGPVVPQADLTFSALVLVGCIRHSVDHIDCRLGGPQPPARGGNKKWLPNHCRLGGPHAPL